MARANNYGKSRKFEVVISPQLDEALRAYMKTHDVKTLAAAGRLAVAEMVGRPELAEGVIPGRPPKHQPAAPPPAAAGGPKKKTARKKTARKKR